VNSNEDKVASLQDWRSKMPVSFDPLTIGQAYSRQDLAQLWGYTAYQALARGVVTPRDDNKIILFVTREKQASATQYQDRIEEAQLFWEGPNDHFAEERIVDSPGSGDEIHLFYRDRHHSDFVYYGQIIPLRSQRFSNQPSQFVFQLTKSQ
jgi:putative restriction endonuclease